MRIIKIHFGHCVRKYDPCYWITLWLLCRDRPAAARRCACFPYFYTRLIEFTHPTLEFYYFESCEITLSYLNFTAISSCCFLVPTQTHRDEPRNLSTRVCQCISFCTENGWSSWPQLVLHLWLLLGTSVFLNLNGCKFRWMVLTYYCLLLAENAVTSFFSHWTVLWSWCSPCAPWCLEIKMKRALMMCTVSFSA